MQAIKTILLTLLALASLNVASLSNVEAHAYRVFYLVLENGIVHGDHIDRDGIIRPDQIREKGDTLHPYHYTANTPSKAAARRELLREVPNAVHVIINDLHWD